MYRRACRAPGSRTWAPLGYDASVTPQSTPSDPPRSRARLALTTAPDEAVARRLAAALVERRLAACVSLVPHLTSIYRWQGRVEEATEVLLLVKTVDERTAELERVLHELHPYDTPELVVLEAAHVAPRYLSWLTDETR